MFLIQRSTRAATIKSSESGLQRPSSTESSAAVVESGALDGRFKNLPKLVHSGRILVAKSVRDSNTEPGITGYSLIIRWIRSPMRLISIPIVRTYLYRRVQSTFC